MIEELQMEVTNFPNVPFLDADFSLVDFGGFIEDVVDFVSDLLTSPILVSAASPWTGVVCKRIEPLESLSTVMKNDRRSLLVRHLSGGELDQAIADAQKADETRLVRRLCYVKNLYAGDTHEEAGDRVGISRSTTRWWARAWNEVGVEGLRPGFGGGRPPKLTNEQFAELCELLKEGQPWTPRAIHALIGDRYGVTYDPAHLSRKLRESGMHYAKPRPMDPRSPENVDETLAERLGEALGEKDIKEDDPVVLGFFR